jgi:hypothetical protein
VEGEIGVPDVKYNSLDAAAQLPVLKPVHGS